jgi:RND family efflux transporter MFP subunit
MRVEVIRPERKTVRQLVEEPAQFKPYEETPVYAKVAGYVRNVNVDMGDRIRGPRFDAQGKETSPGQILLQVFIPELEDDVRQTAAAVAQAEAAVGQARAGIEVAEAALVRAQSIALQTEAAVKRTEADFSKWDSEYKRIVELTAKGALTEKLADETRDQLASAGASREEARAKQKTAEAAIAESRANLSKAHADLLAAQAHVEVTQADHARAITMAQYGIVHAPFDGVVTRRNVHTGHMVQAGSQGDPLLILMRTDILRIQVDVPEADAARIKIGAPVNVRLPALAGEIIAAAISRTADSLDMNTRTLRVEADVPNQTNRLHPGLYGYAAIAVAEHPNALVLPTTAVLADKGQDFCLCVEGERLARRPVVVGLRLKSEVEIASGLQGDETVVRMNSPILAPGQPVEAVPYVPLK